MAHTDFAPKVTNLCRALKKGPVAIPKLAAELRDDEVLGQAFADGLIEVGRPQYALVATNCPGDGSAGKIRRRDGKFVLDEMKRQIMDRENTAMVEDQWSWLNREQRNRAPLSDVLNEKVEDGVPDLCARLTSAGLAATA